jgi:MFS transporter, OFA family, oxalate/formate antiporter
VRGWIIATHQGGVLLKQVSKINGRKYMEQVKSLDPKVVYGPIVGNRWIQLASAVIGMIMIANCQYAWTLFVPALQGAFGWSLGAVQLGFTMFIAFETYSMPIEGYLLDRFGPRMLFTAAGFMVGIGWTALGYISSLPALYFFYGLAGAGAGIIYSGSIAVAIRWFADRRGLASGVIAAGFGAGSAPFIPFIGWLLTAYDYQTAFLVTGIFQGVVVLFVAQILKYPPGDSGAHATAAAKNDPNRGFSPMEMLRTPQFYLIYIMFICMVTSGLLITAQTKPFARDIGIAAYIVILAVTVDRVSNGLGRIMMGGLSDKFGRENTMCVDFILCGIFTACLPILGTSSIGFIVLLFLMMLTWGPIFALFPSCTADRFGTTYAATNYGIVYTAKGFGGIFGGVVAGYLVAYAGWTAIFATAGFTCVLAGLGALVLKRLPKPSRQRFIDECPVCELGDQKNK